MYILHKIIECICISIGENNNDVLLIRQYTFGVREVACSVFADTDLHIIQIF